jgi:ectoine hydroxylase-related dioxygenase (phytanoyl-CoA dioxygenase family)
VDDEDHLRSIDEHGFTIVPDVFDRAEGAALVARLDEVVETHGVTPALNDFEGKSTYRVYNLLTHGPLFERIPIDPATLPIVDDVLDPGCLISSLSSIDIRPGETAQPIHADDQLLPIPKPHIATVCNTMWALTDFTEANGATRVVPGSHKAETSPDYGSHYDSIPAEMSAGSVLIWHGSLWHGGGANTTDQRRVAIAMNYCAGWIRQQENQQLGVSAELVGTFPPRLRELVGYNVYNGLVGHIERQSPEQLMFDHEGAPILWDRRS